MSTFFAMTTKVHIKVEGSVKWLDVNRKVLIECLAEHSGGRYSSLKNKKSAWKLVVADFNVKTGLSLQASPRHAGSVAEKELDNI